VPVPLRPLLVRGAAGHGSSIIPAPVPLRAQLTAAGLQEAAQQAALQHPRLTTQLVAQRAATGVPTTLAAIEAVKVVHEAMQLIVLLPPYALATVCGTSVARLFESAPQQIVDHVLRRTRRRWTSATIGNSWAFVRWATHTIDVPLGNSWPTPLGIRPSSYLARGARHRT
jgi:hypothetical protein